MQQEDCASFALCPAHSSTPATVLAAAPLCRTVQGQPPSCHSCCASCCLPCPAVCVLLQGCGNRPAGWPLAASRHPCQRAIASRRPGCGAAHSGGRRSSTGAQVSLRFSGKLAWPGTCACWGKDGMHCLGCVWWAEHLHVFNWACCILLHTRRLYFAIVRQETRKPPVPSTAASAQRAAVAAPDSGVQQAVSPFAALAGSRGHSPPVSGTASPPQQPAGLGRRPSIESQRSISSVAGGIPAFKRAMPSAFTDVRLGPLIGRGAYGRVRRLPPTSCVALLYLRLYFTLLTCGMHYSTVPSHPCGVQVYRGSWNGTTVAVKVIETTEPLDDAGMAPGAHAATFVSLLKLTSYMMHEQPHLQH